MSVEEKALGRVLRSSTTAFSIGCRQPIADQADAVPAFGALVRAPTAGGVQAYGLVYDTIIEDDPFVRQLAGSGVDREEFIADQRQRRQVPVEVAVLVAGYRIEERMFHRLPPRPPATLDRVYACANDEVARFTESHDWMRLVLASNATPSDQLLAATVRNAASSRSGVESEKYLLGAGRALTRLLPMDPARLEGILQQLR